MTDEVPPFDREEEAQEARQQANRRYQLGIVFTALGGIVFVASVALMYHDVQTGTDAAMAAYKDPIRNMLTYPPLAGMIMSWGLGSAGVAFVATAPGMHTIERAALLYEPNDDE